MTIPIDLAHRPYNSVRTNVLHRDLYSSKMIASKQIRKNERLNSGHNIENTVTNTPI